MTANNVAYLPEEPAHDAAIEEINAEAFGPGRFARAAYKIREGGPHDRTLSFVATIAGSVIGSVRMTPIAAGEGRAMLLGPLAVVPTFKNLGIGKHLVRMAIDAARASGRAAVLLVGDEPYYGPLGFKRVPNGRLVMPRPVDPERLLIHEVDAGAMDLLSGNVVHADIAAHAGVASASGRLAVQPTA